ncbi:MAG: hypothetical protein FWE16_01720 [Firmicutes bacterium]|nr:hypothetical protein [Bacillota bacterium]
MQIGDDIIQYDTLIGADGVSSQLRRDITGKSQRANMYIGCISQTDLNKLEIRFWDKLKGFGGVISNNNFSMIGVGTGNGQTKVFSHAIEQLSNENNVDTRLKACSFAPTGNNIRLTLGDNIFLIGDAAGLASPLGSEGIYYAILSAKMLAENFNKTGYIHAMKKTRKHFRRERFYKKFVLNSFIRNRVFGLYRRQILKKTVDRFARSLLQKDLSK